ncbi:MAG: DUF423 domain-containing protein [Planctomycetales bacterium]|nr:DUF423 domain-containing protein [Planctomycetales bacterium]
MTAGARWIMPSAAIAGATGVIFGAFAAHGLSDYLVSHGADADLVVKRLGQFETGARYHLIHAVALLAIGVLGKVSPAGAIKHGVTHLAAALILAGIIFFSGSLYVLVLTNTPWLGAITPIGGVAWIIGWSLLAFSTAKS